MSAFARPGAQCSASDATLTPFHSLQLVFCVIVPLRWNSRGCIDLVCLWLLLEGVCVVLLAACLAPSMVGTICSVDQAMIAGREVVAFSNTVVVVVGCLIDRHVRLFQLA